VLEDDGLLRTSLVTLFQAAGFEVTCDSANGDDFIARVTARPPQVCVVDLVLERSQWQAPENGCDVIAALHRTFPELGILVFSGSRGADVASACLRAGASRFLDKLHTSMDELVDAVLSLSSQGARESRSA
jgi:DNA-binding NarL/FixJ family response regulator